MNVLNPAIVDRLRVSGPIQSEKSKMEWRLALREGHDMLVKDGTDQPTIKDVIWRLMIDAAMTEARLPIEDRRNLTWWPDTYDLNERLKVQWEIGLEEAAGVRPKAANGVWKPVLSITDPTAIRRMLTVLSWLRHCRWKSIHRRKRDVSILLLRARDVSALSISRMLGGRIGERAVDMIKDRILTQIVEALEKTS